ncbi:ABC transporter permease protein [Renibacterium salmoninarum ATCC 33209]|uniref:ABC transporter permease protein n=1 Tax=Renibacterium salmoninarum (strain ATCC 33209 / DSM 20767 / JCM 11484 / NBRC 15589 / NCIMB 2235) TaxID=288705 RepID=A9WTW5_RENSM|nr:ABC transporter permease [Renibacterium salmoninarum]ABY24636.1 ABC transporter permease protein [Renibacterium salmoninarum ATCC 33209]
MTTAIPASISLERKVPPFGGFNLTLLGIEMKRRLRNRRNVMFALVLPVVMFLIIGLPQKDTAIDPSHPVSAGGVSVAAYIMISMAVYGCMVTSTSAGSAVERSMGWSRQLRLTPLTPAANILVKVVGGLLLGLIAILAVDITGFIIGVRMEPQIWILSGLAGLLGSLVFTALGLLVGYLIPSENVMQIMGPVIAFLAFFGGLFAPLKSLGGVFESVGVWTPTYGIGEIARAPLTGDAFNWLALLNVAIWLVIFVAGAALAFRRDTKRV